MKTILSTRMSARLGAGLKLSALAALLSLAAPVSAESGARFVYDDLDRFAAAMKSIDAGTPMADALKAYVSADTPGMQIFKSRFGLSASSLAERVTERPRYYRHVAQMRPDIEKLEAGIRAAVSRLQESAPPGSRPAPFHFLVAHMRAGANPGLAQTPDGPRPVIAVGVDLVAMSPRVDMSEFPKGPVGATFDELETLAVHETSHVFQMQAQGHDAYRSIYMDPSRRTHLAFAIREGCADFLTWKATGKTLANRRDYVKAHEAALWTEFEPLLRTPIDPRAAWFGPRDPNRPQQPMQIGYGIGMAICEFFHDASTDKPAAMRQIYGAYLPEHFEAILAPYAARMKR